MTHSTVPARLRNIRVIPDEKGWRVALGFMDKRNRPHIRTYSEREFLEALPLLSAPNRTKQLEGLLSLGAMARRISTFGEVYLLMTDDEQFINLGDPCTEPSGGNDILTALREKSLWPNEIRQMLLSRRRHSWSVKGA